MAPLLDLSQDRNRTAPPPPKNIHGDVALVFLVNYPKKRFPQNKIHPYGSESAHVAQVHLNGMSLAYVEKQFQQARESNRNPCLCCSDSMIFPVGHSHDSRMVEP